MAWGRFVELYVMSKKSETESDSDKIHAVIGCSGELWTKAQVLNFAKALSKFSKNLNKAIEEHGAENICVRTNT